MELLERKPLRLDAPVLFVVWAERFLPATADAIEALGVHGMFFDEQTLDFVRPLLAEVGGLEGHLPHERVATAFAKLFDHRAIDVPAEQDGGTRADLQEPFDGFEVFQVVLVVEIEIGRVGGEEEPDILAQEWIALDWGACRGADRRDGHCLIFERPGLIEALEVLQLEKAITIDRVFDDLGAVGENGGLINTAETAGGVD